VSSAAPSTPSPDGGTSRPSKPPPSVFGLALTVGAIAFTVVSVVATDFSFAGIIEDLSRPNSSVEGLLDIDWSQVVNDRTLAAFVETVQMAVVGTVIGGFAALPLALWNSRVGAPNAAVFWIVKVFNNVVRAIPDVLWALLFVAMVGTGALPGILALVFFSIAVVSKLTSDVLDGLDLGPVEAAHAVGARHTQMLRTAIVPQVLPAYSSFLLYSVELNLRASAVLGLVGAGGIGTRIEFYRGRGEWSEVWGIIVLFFIVTFVVERISLTFRRRLV
jgi:phosphonate transport system permease protein